MQRSQNDLSEQYKTHSKETWAKIENRQSLV